MSGKTGQHKTRSRTTGPGQEHSSAAAARTRAASPGKQNAILGLQHDAGNQAVNSMLPKSGSGKPLDPGMREQMEASFGEDFSNVRLHTDAQAAKSAQVLTAQAYTVGQDIVFGKGRYAPNTGVGQRLLAHELGHVVQQRQAAQIDKDTMSRPGDGCERAADRAAQLALTGQRVFVDSSGAPPAIQRQTLSSPDNDDPGIERQTLSSLDNEDPGIERRARLDQAEKTEQDLLKRYSIDPRVAAGLDKDAKALGEDFKKRVQSAASTVGLDPGFLAASIFAEIGTRNLKKERRTVLAKHSEGVDSGFFGLDDLVEKLPQLKKAVPELRKVFPHKKVTVDADRSFRPEHTDTGVSKSAIDIPGDKAVLTFAAYQKTKENTIRKLLEKRNGPKFDSLPAEQRFFLARLALNPGKQKTGAANIRHSLDKVARGKDLLRKNIGQERKQDDPVGGATLTALQGLHLARTFFDRNPFE